MPIRWPRPAGISVSMARTPRVSGLLTRCRVKRSGRLVVDATRPAVSAGPPSIGRPRPSSTRPSRSRPTWTCRAWPSGDPGRRCRSPRSGPSGRQASEPGGHRDDLGDELAAARADPALGRAQPHQLADRGGQALDVHDQPDHGPHPTGRDRSGGEDRGLQPGRDDGGHPWATARARASALATRASTVAPSCSAMASPLRSPASATSSTSRPSRISASAPPGQRARARHRRHRRRRRGRCRPAPPGRPGSSAAGSARPAPADASARRRASRARSGATTAPSSRPTTASASARAASTTRSARSSSTGVVRSVQSCDGRGDGRVGPRRARSGAAARPRLAAGPARRRPARRPARRPSAQPAA